MGIWTRFSNPHQFQKLTNAIYPWVMGGAAVSFAVGLWLALVQSPPDYQQGELVRIMYAHVPAAWTSLQLYTLMALASAIGLVFRHTLTDVFCIAAAPVGAGLTALCLITGSIWGQPTWGTWWVWDARLTSMLILFLLYLGFIALRHSFEDHERGGKAGALLLIVGGVNIPIIKFSVNWWHTLHQPASVLKLSGPTVDSSMLAPLLVMVLAYTLLMVGLIIIRMRMVLTARRMEALALRMSDAEASIFL
jgi:heme exporter protein C